MIFDNMFRQNNILGAAAQASVVRNEVINNNIANADTPRFKANTVDFEQSLIKAIDKFKKTRKLDLSDVEPTLRPVARSFSYRIDKNNVDIELEMVALYQNLMRYEAFINITQRNSQRITLALTGR